MARIPMTGGFTLIPEGVDIFRIYEVIYDETFGKIQVKLVNAKGITHIERFQIKGNKGEANEGALNAFSYFAKTALNDFTIEDVDPDELVDHYIECEVTHTTSQNKNDPTKTVTFANLGNKNPADGFKETPVDKALTLGKKVNVAEEVEKVSAPTGAPTTATGLDLNSLLS